jgi:hypothetical protein
MQLFQKLSGQWSLTKHKSKRSVDLHVTSGKGTLYSFLLCNVRNFLQDKYKTELTHYKMCSSNELSTFCVSQIMRIQNIYAVTPTKEYSLYRPTFNMVGIEKLLRYIKLSWGSNKNTLLQRHRSDFSQFSISQVFLGAFSILWFAWYNRSVSPSVRIKQLANYWTDFHKISYCGGGET